MTKLQAYLRANEISQAAFALMVGLNQGTISKLCAGRITPSIETAGRIESATKGAVPFSAWLEGVQE